MNEEVIALARAMCPEAAENEQLLELLCMAAWQRWEARLRSDIRLEECMEAFCCAVAMSAAANLTLQAQEEISSFTAGEISVKTKTAGESRQRAADLRQAAEELMALYAVPEDFSFKGV